MSWVLILEVFKNACLVTGLVVVMMMTIEYVNVRSAGKWFASLKGSKLKQVLLGSLLGLIPGCVGGFASVSLFSHGLISIGALVAAMIASSGDEAFVILAMIPQTALLLFGALFAIAFVSGIIVDKLYKKEVTVSCDQEFELHESHLHGTVAEKGISFSRKKVIIALGLLVFAIALLSGVLEHEHIHAHGHHDHDHHGISLLDERWINILFGVISLVVLFLTVRANNHFVKEHLWNHVIKKHCLSIFLWTFGALAVIEIGLQYVDIEPWLEKNAFLIMVVAALVGIIPESGPHLVFITLFAGGYVPFSVLLASSVSQDGHTALPLLASDKLSFIKTKIINVLIAIVCGGILMLFGL